MYQNTIQPTEELKNTWNQPAEEENITIGIVTDCSKLNVREEPNSDAVVVCKVDNQAELMIDETESTDDFYKVCTAAGIEGFCMRKFVSIQS